MSYNQKYVFNRVKYHHELDPGLLENVKNILDASPIQGVVDNVIDNLVDDYNAAHDGFIRSSLVEVGIDPDALLKTAKLNAHLQMVLKNTMQELEAKKDAVDVVRCKECRYWGCVTFGDTCRKLSGIQTRICTQPNDFCSFGERKEE